MKVIRHSMFETNSSSTHSIAISKKKVNVKSLPSKINFYIGDFGWSHEEVNRANYFYTALALNYGKDGLDDALKHVKSVLLNIGVDSEFSIPEWYDSGRLANGYIDHFDEIREFVTTLMSDDQMLIRYLFSDSHVYTGNDNQEFDNDNATKYVSKSKVYEYDNDTNDYKYVINKNHDENKYDYFFKGN